MFSIEAIGTCSRPLTDLDAAPRQADEGAPEAWLVLSPSVEYGLSGIRTGDEILVHLADCAWGDVLVVHPRGDVTRPQEGVFTHDRRIARTRLVCTRCG